MTVSGTRFIRGAVPKSIIKTLDGGLEVSCCDSSPCLSRARTCPAAAPAVVYSQVVLIFAKVLLVDRQNGKEISKAV